MPGLIQVILAFLLFFLIIAVFPLQIEFYYRKDDQKDHVIFRLQLIRSLWVYELEVPLLKMQEKGLWPGFVVVKETESASGVAMGKDLFVLEKPWVLLRRILSVMPWGHVGKYIDLMLKILKTNSWLFKHVRCKKLRWVTQIGFSDPAWTGMATGSLWSIKGYLYRNLYQNVQVDFAYPEMIVIPNFQQAGLELDFNCIFSLRIGHIIIAGITMLWHSVRTLVLRG